MNVVTDGLVKVNVMQTLIGCLSTAEKHAKFVMIQIQHQDQLQSQPLSHHLDPPLIQLLHQHLSHSLPQVQVYFKGIWGMNMRNKDGFCLYYYK